MEDNQVSVFKSFLREQLKNQEEIKKALESGDMERAKELLEEMIERTQQGIEDN